MCDASITGAVATARRRLKHHQRMISTPSDSASVDTCSADHCASKVALVGGNNGVPLEGWSVGQRFATRRRTLAESDVVNFCNLTGYSSEALFRDTVYLESVGHLRRLAPGLLTLAVADALIVGSGVLEGFAIGLVSIDGFRAIKPVYAGDTIHVELEVLAVNPSKSKPNRGVVVTKQIVCNQHEDTVAQYTVARMLKRAS